MSASISSVITAGFGAPGSAALVITDGFGQGATIVVPTAPTTQPGVGRARFLRRGPRLPWDKEDEVTVPEQVVVRSRIKKIPLPIVQKMEAATSPIPIQPNKHLDGIQITIPAIGTATLANQEDDEEDILIWLM